MIKTQSRLIPPRHSPAKIVTAIVENNTVYGLIDRPHQAKEYDNTLNSNTLHRAILAEWDAHYLKLGHQWHRQLNTLNSNKSVDKTLSKVHNWMGNKLSHTTLCQNLNDTPVDTLIYFGHGHLHGLSGYQGLYSQDIIRSISRPINLFINFSCETIGHRRSFGRTLVNEGAVTSYLGATRPVDTLANTRLIHLALKALKFVDQTKNQITLQDWLHNLHINVLNESNDDLLAAWHSYRLLGSPRGII